MGNRAEINSSEIDLPPQRDENDNTNIGKRLTRIIQGSVQDRVNSKIAVRTLADTANAPNTVYQRNYWYKLSVSSLTNEKRG